MQIAICPNCNINTAGNHAWNCPFNPNYNSSNTMIYNQPNNILTSPKNMNTEPNKEMEKIVDELAIRLGDTNRQTYEERLGLCRQSLTQIAEEAKKEENEAWLRRERCSICGKAMKPKITTDTCDKCFEDE